MNLLRRSVLFLAASALAALVVNAALAQPGPGGPKPGGPNPGGVPNPGGIPNPGGVPNPGGFPRRRRSIPQYADEGLEVQQVRRDPRYGRDEADAHYQMPTMWRPA